MLQLNNYFEEMIPDKKAKITIQENPNIIWVNYNQLVEDELFEELFSDQQFIKGIRETDDLYTEDPTRFASLSKLYRKTKKIK